MDQITPSIQDYLKALRELSPDGTPVHSAAVAARLGVTRASVSRTMNVLKQDGFVLKEKYGTIQLTREGLQAADQVAKRNRLLKTFLINILQVSEKTALRDACRMEHAISAETELKLQQFLEANELKEKGR